ncbi:hypothetical protein [Bifidobacterium tissieri]|uniref:Uncharacterized protein n=2 Tax=Bifidobacterium tissieri TaxID=1630162 RepID=A0A5M9ZW50_9BIFI|nr:hypothetical protein [Bifidobacterium tissieri]KAA8829273.1 hypothetical protein EMO89_08205 [Bifidobacterium tissieri]KAA8831877.1 hypothetical protein EM849_06420 [Bifidobacterium tissieri]
MAPTSSNRKSDTTPAGSPTSAAPDNAAALPSAESIPSANPFAANAAKVPLFSADSTSTVELPKTVPGRDGRPGDIAETCSDLPPTTPLPVTSSDAHASTVNETAPTMPIPAVASSDAASSGAVPSANSAATRIIENVRTTSNVPYTGEFRADASTESTIPIPGKAVRLAVDGDDNSGDNSSTRSDTVHTTAHNSGDINNTATTVHATAQVEEHKESEESEQSEEPSPWKTGVSALTITFGLILLMLSSVGFLAVYRFPEPVFSSQSGSIDAILLAALLAVSGLALIAGVLIRTFRHVRA